MKNKSGTLILLAAIGLLLAACGSTSDNVPSLKPTPTIVVEQEILDDEAAVMAFVQCMRDEGIEFKDPVVDADGNVLAPELVEGFTVTRAELAAPYKACSHHIESLTFGRERGDATERVDQFVVIATCFSPVGGRFPF